MLAQLKCMGESIQPSAEQGEVGQAAAAKGLFANRSYSLRDNKLLKRMTFIKSFNSNCFQAVGKCYFGQSIAVEKSLFTN